MNERDDFLRPQAESGRASVAQLGVDASRLDDIGLRDLSERLAAADVEGSSRLLGVERKKGRELVRRHSEALGGASERAALRTPDARKLGRELLSLFSELASSGLVREMIEVTAPTLKAGIIQQRLTLCVRGRSLRRALRDAGELEAVTNQLKKAAFEAPKQGELGVLDYFLARRRFLDVASSILDECGEVAEVRGFLESIRTPQVAALSRTLEEAGGGATEDAEAVVGDAEVVINEEFRRGRVDADSAKRTVEAHIVEIVSALGMNATEEEGLRRSAMEGLRIPFEFEKGTLREVLWGWRKRREEESARRRAELETALRRQLGLIDLVVSKVLEMDRALAIASAAELYSLVEPIVGSQGEGFVNGRNPFLVKESGSQARQVAPVSYSLGRTRAFKVAQARNVAVLTGANSGGKTTLLTTLASIHILALYGLPVPCDEAEVIPVPVYLFRKRVTRRIGSLEHALSSLIPVFGDRRRKLVLIDEFEALTEPGAAGRIMAAVLNEAASGSSLLLVVTHLARETLPHVRLPIRVDGIEAKGLDPQGNLLVDRQPIFGHIGSSTPKLIIMKLSRSTKNRKAKALYEEILSSIREEKVQVQAPIATPWTKEEG